MRDTTYYDAESVRYSDKRYPKVPGSHIQSFYLHRLRVVIALVCSYVHGTDRKLIEIGCADGVVTNALYDNFPGMFGEIAGVDISPKMIEAAQSHKGARDITFGVRDTFPFAPPYDLVIEVGVINYADENREFESAQRLIGADGIYLCSIAGSDSLYCRLKPGQEEGFSNMHSYAVYEAKLRERFTIVKAVPVGLFIPLIWKIPVLARIIQPVCEILLAPILPNLFHEKVYVVRSRTA